MFTAKDLEVYKDALKEKKNKATKTGEKPLKTPPSVAKISKAPLKLQNEEPIKERKPLSVVHKASNTIKDTHKPPSPHPVGTSKQTNPGFKIKEITSKSPSPGNLHPTEPTSLVKASDIKSEPLKSPRESSLPKPPHIKPDDNKIAGLHKLKEPSTPGASHGVYQRSPSLSAVKVAPAVNVNASLCSECTRAASEGAVCFIGNDGRVSACTTRSAVRLCKNLNCAANNPEYVAAMANAPKKYLISKRHSLKAQFGLKIKSGGSKSPNLQQTGDARVHGWQQSSDALSPSKGDMSPLNGDNIDTSLNNLVLESEDGELSPVNHSLRLLDGDMSLLDANDAFCDSEMGLMNDVLGDMACREDYAAAEQGIAKHRDVINEFSFHEGEAGETESPKFASLESSKEHVEALSESNGYDDANPHADAKSFELTNSEELDDEDAYGSPNLRASDADIPSMKDYEDTSLNVNGEQVDGKAQMASMTGVSQVEDENQIGNIISTSDISQLPDDHQTGDKFKNNQVADNELIGGVTSTVDVNQVTDGFMAVIDTSQAVHSDDRDGDLTPLKIDDGNSTSSIDTHVAHNNQSGGTENNKDDGQSRDNGDKKSLLIGHVVDNGHGDDISMLNGEHSGDDKLLLNDASSVIVTSPNGGHIADDGQGDVTSLNDGHGADDEQCDDLTSPNDGHGADDEQCDDLTAPHGMHVMDGNVIISLDDTQVADEGDNVLSPHSKHEADNEESVETAFPHDKQVLEDCLSHGFTSPNDRHVAEDCLGHDFTAPYDRHVADGDESDEDDNEDGETDEIIKNICVTDDSSSIGLQKSLDSTKKSIGSGGEDGSASSSMKGNKQRRRRVLNVVEESNPETVTLRKQQTQERKQAEEWMINYAIEGVVHKLAPTGEAKVKILVEAFESIISHTDAEGIDTHNASKEKHTLA